MQLFRLSAAVTRAAQDHLLQYFGDVVICRELNIGAPDVSSLQVS